jgi:hypothetical protein
VDQFYSDIDLRQNVILGRVEERVAAFPALARMGRTVFHTGFGQAYVCSDDSGDTTHIRAWAPSTVRSVTAVAGPGVTAELDQVPVDVFRTAKWNIGIETSDGKFRTIEVLAVHSITTARHHTSAVGDAAPCTVDVTVSTGMMRLLVTNHSPTVTLSVAAVRIATIRLI